MEESSRMTVLGALLERDALASQPDGRRMAASWQAISQAIAPPAASSDHRSGANPDRPRATARTRAPGSTDDNWAPHTAFNPRPASRGSWRYPSRRIAFQTLALVLLVGVFLAAGLLFSRGGFVNRRPLVTIPDSTIPLTSVARPSIDQLKLYLSDMDSQALLTLMERPSAEQRSALEALSRRAGFVLTELPAGNGQQATYWTARITPDASETALLILARQQAGQSGWTVACQLAPADAALPEGAMLDAGFDALMAASAG